MALLKLENIGKIYVSGNNVSVGIRGVNLSFDRGEFVAVTGKSGSGKSTLLNVISGMDTYEEGELYIEGKPTSHYLQPDWEEYRKKYISFIFQDYNIIDSFTVLQNVELALMHIKNKKERRKKALGLIDRVGLTSHIKHKGSKLSGGQKQRTVIARALAKDSPIILADEPTGNLDSETSKEIIELLKEVSADKLVIVVTHNFEQVEKYATRHIRVFDSAIESDRVIKSPDVSEGTKNESGREAVQKRKRKYGSSLGDGISLGRVIFAAKPKLSAFLCILMLIGTMGIFFVTSQSSDIRELFRPAYMFSHIDGRVVVMKKDGGVLSGEELDAICRKYGAVSCMHYDNLIDADYRYNNYYYDKRSGSYEFIEAKAVYGKDYGRNITGRYPVGNDEAFLYLPISYADVFGRNSIEKENVILGGVPYKVTGIKYYYDNNRQGEYLLTEEGFRNQTCVHYFLNAAEKSLAAEMKGKDGVITEYIESSVIPTYAVEDGKILITDSKFTEVVKNGDSTGLTLRYSNTKSGPGDSQVSFVKDFGSDVFTDKEAELHPEILEIIELEGKNYGAAYISPYFIRSLIEEELEKTYRQASVFFENDRQAGAAAEKMQDDGFTAVPSYSTRTEDPGEVLLNVISGVFSAVLWVIFILFLGFFINLCSSRSLEAFKGDMAIMRSMGISVKTIKSGMYVRMFISLIPAFAAVIITALLIFMSPRFNRYFMYLYPWQYLIIFVGMVLLTVRITGKQIKKLFSESVRVSLRGGMHND